MADADIAAAESGRPTAEEDDGGGTTGSAAASRTPVTGVEVGAASSQPFPVVAAMAPLLAAALLLPGAASVTPAALASAGAGWFFLLPRLALLVDEAGVTVAIIAAAFASAVSLETAHSFHTAAPRWEASPRTISDLRELDASLPACKGCGFVLSAPRRLAVVPPRWRREASK